MLEQKEPGPGAEWRYFRVSSECRQREKQLFEKYGVTDTVEVLMKIEAESRCLSELLARIEPGAPLPASCTLHFRDAFRSMADGMLAVLEIIYGSGLKRTDHALTQADDN